MVEEELVRFIARNLVNDPEQVALTRRDAGKSTILELRVAKEDMGRVIGRSGRIANAMRDLLRTTTELKRGKRVILEIE